MASDSKSPGFFERIGFGRQQDATEEEVIKDLVTDADELLEDEKRMIHEILDLGDMTVREIMQPRVDVISVEDTETVRAAFERMRGTGYSRLPVFHEDEDNIVGIVYYKDLVVPLLDGDDDDSVLDYLLPPLYVPETKDIFPLLSEMQSSRHHMAIVVDEYGGTDGIITIEDILEEIVGEIIDESDLENKYITKLNETTWLADGRFPIEEALELGWPVSDSDDYETIAGWLMDILDSVPKPGQELQRDGYVFRIEKMRRRRISTIRVTKG